jgi:hypothetical protein
MFRVLALERGTVGISRHGFKYTVNFQVQAADARLAFHAARCGRYAV